ncbi:hypothetical protein YC2023_055152 [Brassica napus]
MYLPSQTEEEPASEPLVSVVFSLPNGRVDSLASCELKDPILATAFASCMEMLGISITFVLSETTATNGALGLDIAMADWALTGVEAGSAELTAITVSRTTFSA